MEKKVKGVIRMPKSHLKRFNESDQELVKIVRDNKFGQNQNIDLPDGLQAELRPYQKDGYRWLTEHYHQGLGACLADDMGLGKHCKP
ncbi:MAG: DEAD/DEAH box helicase [Saprospiraceae bacterium]|nr:DEAD/DEAH box helicase [Candidatus Vicinibacter proximus]